MWTTRRNGRDGDNSDKISMLTVARVRPLVTTMVRLCLTVLDLIREQTMIGASHYLHRSTENHLRGRRCCLEIRDLLHMLRRMICC